jgi:hypothetical protein
MNKLINRLLSRETWQRVGWYIRMKSWEEAPPSMKIPKDDILPIVITIIIGILILGIGIPFALEIAKLLKK